MHFHQPLQTLSLHTVARKPTQYSTNNIQPGVLLPCALYPGHGPVGSSSLLRISLLFQTAQFALCVASHNGNPDHSFGL